MTSKERYLATMRGQEHDRVPVTPIFMTWAAHYVGRTYREFYLDTDACVVEFPNSPSRERSGWTRSASSATRGARPVRTAWTSITPTRGWASPRRAAAQDAAEH